MGLIEICNRLEEFIVDIYGTQDYENMNRQMELKTIQLKSGEQREVIMLKKGGGAYEANAAYFKIKADAAVDFEGNVYIPFFSEKRGESRYVYIRKIKREDVHGMVREIMNRIRENNEQKGEVNRELPRLVL